MDSVKMDLAGVREVGLRFDEFPDALYEDFRKEIEALSLELFARVEVATPDLTGRLRSQERVHLFTDPNQIAGNVYIEAPKGSPTFAKAAALEYGAHKSTKVSAHSMTLDHHWAEQLKAPETVLVEAYSRTVNIAEVAFERGTLAAMQPEVVARLNAVVERAVAVANA